VGNFPNPCLDCGELTQGGNRCVVHQRRVDELAEARRALIKKTLNTYGGDYKRRAKQVRDSAVVCHLCGEGARFGDPWEADHLIPGDSDSPLAAAHGSCNRRRGNKSLD
jgi:hypothetical protein